MSVHRIVTIAMAMRGTEGDEELLVPLCQMAMENLLGRLRPGVSVEDCSAAFEIAAAWLALDHLEAAGGAVKSFSAGDISVNLEGGGLGFRQRAEQLMAPYVLEKTFAFMGVKG